MKKWSLRAAQGSLQPYRQSSKLKSSSGERQEAREERPGIAEPKEQ
jgi:hypothetical protein